MIANKTFALFKESKALKELKKNLDSSTYIYIYDVPRGNIFSNPLKPNAMPFIQKYFRIVDLRKSSACEILASYICIKNLKRRKIIGSW